jgi:transcriptional regulator with GAF, ATPase, and Fis domain
MRRLATAKRYLEDEIRTAHQFEEIIGESAALQQVLTHVEVVAPTDATVPIQGETGTGLAEFGFSTADLGRQVGTGGFLGHPTADVS